MLLMIDNYDSFTYNLVQYFGELGETVTTIRNDQATLAELIELNPDHVAISPGPCDPDQAGISLEVIEHFAGKVPILGAPSLPVSRCQWPLVHLGLRRSVVWCSCSAPRF